MSEKKLQIIPLGGLGEFGMNCMALRYGDDIIVVDAGMMFPDTELMGVDIVTPDFAYLEQNAAHVRGLILTHGHEAYRSCWRRFRSPSTGRPSRWRWWNGAWKSTRCSTRPS
jgi:predicted metal-dependent RNase